MSQIDGDFLTIKTGDALVELGKLASESVTPGLALA